MGVVERKVKILEVLSKATEPMRPAEIGEILGYTPLDAGNYLLQLSRSKLVEKPNRKKSFYGITDKGREWMENPPEDIEEKKVKSEDEERKRRAGMKSENEEPERKPLKKDGDGDDFKESPPKEPPPAETLPSQADIFRGFGERMGIGGTKGEVKLDAILYYLGKTADFDDPVSIWNGLTQMGVDTNVKKRWLKLYLLTIPSKKIPDELKLKLESGFDEKVDTTKETEEAKKPKFAVDETTGRIRAAKDSEIPMTWVEAERVSDRIKGEIKKDETPASEPAFVTGVDGAFTMNPKAKIGLTEFTIFQMYQDSLRRGNPIDPIQELTNREEQVAKLKESWGMKGKEGDSETGTLERLQKLGLLKAGGGDLSETLALLDGMGMLKKPSAEGENTGMKELRQELASLKDALSKKDMEAVTTELTGVKGVIATLRQEMELARSSQAAKGEFDIMSQAIGMVDRRLGAIENTVTGFLKKPPTPLSKDAKAEITGAIIEEVKNETEIDELGATLWGPKTS